MSRFLSKTLTLIQNTAAAKPFTIRFISTQPPKISSTPEISMADAEAIAVEKIEDAIHNIIVKRSKPDWLPFVPGASYWVPPRRSSYGVAEIVKKLANPLNQEQCLAVTSLQGWPSSDFYINNVEPSHLDLSEEDEISPTTSAQLEEA